MRSSSSSSRISHTIRRLPLPSIPSLTPTRRPIGATQQLPSTIPNNRTNRRALKILPIPHITLRIETTTATRIRLVILPSRLRYIPRAIRRTDVSLIIEVIVGEADAGVTDLRSAVGVEPAEEGAGELGGAPDEVLPAGAGGRGGVGGGGRRSGGVADGLAVELAG
jgi:hypothetical protein